MFNTIRIEKSLYNISGKTFTQALSEIDPDENYTGTAFDGLDAFERQLKRFDIRVSGEGCDRVEKFFATTESAVLFPEFVRRTIKAGMDAASILPSIVAAKTYTDGLDFRGLSVNSASEAVAVENGGEIPATTVKLASTASSLTKYARRLSCSYEAVRKQRIEAFAVILRNLGGEISRAVNKAACTALLSGVTPQVISGSAPTYAELAEFWGTMTNYDMTTIIATPAAIASIMALDEMKCNGSCDKVKTPFGVEIVKCANIGSDVAIGLDRNAALEMIYATDVVVDFDKLISTQCDEISASITVGFSKLTSDAVKAIETA